MGLLDGLLGGVMGGTTGGGRQSPSNPLLDAGALSRIFGEDQLGRIAQQLGISHAEAAGQLAQTLPQVVDGMTPDGQIAEGRSDLVNQALAILARGGG